MKIGIVGSGISGLLAARLLGERHSVTLFEADQRLGGHVHTQTVDVQGKTHHVDTGFIVFNRQNYPVFTKLLDELGVDSQPTEMSFGVSHAGEGWAYCGRSGRTLFADWRLLGSARHWRLLADLRRFMADSPAQTAMEPALSLNDFVRRFGYSHGFEERFLSPIAAALWSYPAADVGGFPARFVVRFLAHHGMLALRNRPRWEVLQGGSHTYVSRLADQLRADVRQATPVERIARTSSGVTVEFGSSLEHFDEAVIACHADDALHMHHNPSSHERSLLGAFHYRPNDTVLHTDASVMPRQRAAWASWNYRLMPGEGATVTYDMNRLMGLSSELPLLVSLNQTSSIAPASILSRQTYRHPVASFEAEAAKQERSTMIRHQGFSYCGAYWGNGFHEDGARSALEVASAFEGVAT